MCLEISHCAEPAAFVCKWLSLSAKPGQPSAWVQDRSSSIAAKGWGGGGGGGQQQGEEGSEKKGS